jgi:IS605 OrfB family transposase
VGIDVGLKTFATLSDGQEIANPRFFRAEEKTLAKVQRAHNKLEMGTPERAKHRHAVARVHERIAWRRGDFAHQHSRRTVSHFDLIAVEDLSVNRMTHNHCLAKSIHDAAWSQFANLLAYKAAWAGRRFVAVNPAYTSQDCSQCGHRQPLSLADRTYTCPCCGVVLDRDFNASLNSVRLGQQSLASAEKLPDLSRRVVTATLLKVQKMQDSIFSPQITDQQYLVEHAPQLPFFFAPDPRSRFTTSGPLHASYPLKISPLITDKVAPWMAMTSFLARPLGYGHLRTCTDKSGHDFSSPPVQHGVGA